MMYVGNLSTMFYAWLQLSETVSAQSADALGYCLSEKEFDKILKLFESLNILFNSCFKFQISNYTL